MASKHKKERVYVTLNGYRWDDFKVYAYKSDDYGQSWTAISGNIPASPVNVIIEDSENENILYLGTDNGAYVSFNGGESWELFSNGLPNVAMHDMVIQPESKDLLLGTHGRSIYKANIAPLQMMNDDMASEAITIFNLSAVRYSSRWGSSWSKWLDAYEPEKTIQFYSNSSGNKTIRILSENGAELNSMNVKVDKGFNYVDYNLELSAKGRKALMKENTSIDINKASNGKYYLPQGTYTLQIDNAKTELKIK